MRLKLVLTAMFLLVSAAAVATHQAATTSDKAADPATAPVATEQGSRFVVHEWGTFTSFSGSDGVKLEFRPLVDVDLPPFVLDRASQSGIPNPNRKYDLRALQRMETPVTYFYTDQARLVHVRVGFPQGLLTEFFPPVEKFEPEFKWNTPEPLTGSALDWGQVWIIPTDRLRADVASPELAAQLNPRILKKLLPATYVDDHYAFARQTDSALVYVERQADEKHPLAPRGGFFEKFLFYRGLGNFDLPVKLFARMDGQFELTNLGSQPIRALFLVSVDGEQLRFVKYDEVRSGARLELIQSEHVSSVDELSAAVVQALIDQHLYEKEARAMVNTWRSSWFGEQGTRLFYVLPQTTTDQLLPLEISPSPDELVRVMVGRLEFMRPEDEARVTELVKQSRDDRAAVAKIAADDPAADVEPYTLPQAVIDLGRLAEPALVRVKCISDDAEIRYEAQILLGQLREYRNGMTKDQ